MIRRGINHLIGWLVLAVIVWLIYMAATYRPTSTVSEEVKEMTVISRDISWSQGFESVHSVLQDEKGKEYESNQNFGSEGSTCTVRVKYKSDGSYTLSYE